MRFFFNLRMFLPISTILKLASVHWIMKHYGLWLLWIMITDTLTKKRVNYQKFSPPDRYSIGKWTAEFVTANTLRRFKCFFPNLKESTVRSIRQKSEEVLRQALKQKRDPMKTLNPVPRARLLMLRKLDKMVHDYLRVVRRRGGVVSKSVAVSNANALINVNQKETKIILI